MLGSVQQKWPHALSHLNISCCRFVYVWDTNSRRILYKLPGHDGSVNDVDFHPNELICEYIQFNLYGSYKFAILETCNPFIHWKEAYNHSFKELLLTVCFFVCLSLVMSCGSDKKIYLGELQP